MEDSVAIANNGALWWGIIPALDGQTIVSIAVGIIVTIATFIIGYKQTIGARDERLRSANLSLAASVLRRIAVEREQMPLDHFEALKRATSYRAMVPEPRLHAFTQSLDIALSDTLASEFLDTDSDLLP
jgi:hypothetical protein